MLVLGGATDVLSYGGAEVSVGHQRHVQQVADDVLPVAIVVEAKLLESPDADPCRYRP